MPAKPVYALVGEDSFLQLQKLAEIRALLPKDTQVVDVDGEQSELADVLDELRSFAMFGGGKLVVVRDADDFVSRFRDKLEDYLASPSDSGVLVLRLRSLPKTQRIFKLISKVGQVYECAPLKQHQLPAWIVNRAKTVHKLAVDLQAAALLADLIGADLGRIDNELAKLALQVSGGRLTSEAVLAGVSFQREQEMWDLTNELAMGRPVEALKRWRHLVQLDSSAEFRAVAWLTMWLEDVDTILRGGDLGKMSWKYRDRLPQFVKVARSFDHQRLRRAVDLLAEMDFRTKSGLGDAATNVEQFILSLAGS
ncbi:DNA polymerase III subunit delta [Fontivita pretiosa]|uniref:DNA polymerase III subunit delta n=1 Tax=Fontivita pretiosa TaxID=2989684 RepID=UPI003D17AAB4